MVGWVKQAELNNGGEGLDTQCAKLCSLPRGPGGLPPRKF